MMKHYKSSFGDESESQKCLLMRTAVSLTLRWQEVDDQEDYSIHVYESCMMCETQCVRASEWLFAHRQKEDRWSDRRLRDRDWIEEGEGVQLLRVISSSTQAIEKTLQ